MMKTKLKNLLEAKDSDKPISTYINNNFENTESNIRAVLNSYPKEAKEIIKFLNTKEKAEIKKLYDSGAIQFTKITSTKDAHQFLDFTENLDVFSNIQNLSNVKKAILDAYGYTKEQIKDLV